jgi:hypothetical protein
VLQSQTVRLFVLQITMEHTTDSITNKKLSITSKDTYKILYTLLLIVVVIAIGMFALNQAFSWYYKAELLSNPCDLCLKLNPNLTLTQSLKVDFYHLNYNP